jgi:hypothetical protein
MKKVIIAAILLIATSGVLFAQTETTGKPGTGTNKNAPGFVDVNKNNICDTHEGNSQKTANNSGQKQLNKKGQKPGYGKRNGQCNSQAQQGKRAGNRSCGKATK